jgi:sugar lactone lactonase YvrE
MRLLFYSIITFMFLCGISAIGSTANGQPLKLYWADEYAGRIYKADPDGSNLETLITGDHLNSEEIVYGDGKIYWSDDERGIIQRANTDGSSLETVVETPEPKALGLDLGAGKLYWVDATLGEIRRANLDGTSPETVQALVSFPIISLTIYETGQLIVWSEYDGVSSPTVDRVFTLPIAGGTPDPIYLNFDKPPVRGLAVAENTGLVYFGFGPDLYRMTITGSNVTRLYSSGVSISAVVVDILDSDLYWADDGNHDILRSDLLGGNIVVLETHAYNVDGLAITPSAGKVFWTEERFIVRAEDDGSGQVHIVSRPSYFGVGFHDALERIYWSDLNKLETYYADSDGTNQNVFWAGGVSTGGALAIHVDDTNSKVYWLDGGDRWLRKADPDGSNLETVMYLPGDAYDIALDLPGARVYWCGRSTGRVFRHNLDASGTTDTLYMGLNLPRGIALDYSYNRVLWGEDNQIASGPINGGGPVTVAFTDPFVVMGMAWDEDDERLYWADQLYNRVRRASYSPYSGWGLPETIFNMGTGHWPGRLVLQYDAASGVTDGTPVRQMTHFAAPNPFNPRTTIHFSMADPGVVDVVIYDVLGRRVRELVRNTHMPAGRQRVEWNGKGELGRGMASGVYLYRIEANGQSMTGRMVLLK